MLSLLFNGGPDVKFEAALISHLRETEEANIVHKL